MENIDWDELIPWINFGVMVLSTVLMTFFYLRSSRPAHLAKKIGDDAYKKCGRYRVIASVFELILIGTYVVYSDYPLPLPIPGITRR